jgi:hypothetical protein
MAKQSIQAHEVEQDVREAWERDGPKHPGQSIVVHIPYVTPNHLSRTFRKDVLAWGFVQAFKATAYGPKPFGYIPGDRWMAFTCRPYVPTGVI